jgi:hypothetical protein
MDDLKQRVQARLDELDEWVEGEKPGKHLRWDGNRKMLTPVWTEDFRAVWAFSLRERWERHHPHEGLPGDHAPSGCWDCRDMVGDRIYIWPSLCPDALAVLCEIGVAP